MTDLEGAFNQRGWIVRVTFASVNPQSVVIAIDTDYAKTAAEAVKVAVERSKNSRISKPHGSRQFALGDIIETRVLPDTPANRKQLEVDGDKYFADQEIAFQKRTWYDLDVKGLPA